MSSETLLHDIQLERFILGAVLVDESRLDLLTDECGLTPADFYRDAHQTIYAQYLKLAEASVPVQYPAVLDALKRCGKLEDIGGPAYLAALTDAMPHGGNVVPAGESVRKYAQQRRCVGALTRALNQARDTTADVSASLDGAIQSLLDISQGVVRTDYKVGDDLLLDLSTELARITQQSEDGITGTPSGLVDLDKITGGFQTGDLAYIAARPGMGKTALAVSIVEHVLLNTSKACAFFTLEMKQNAVMMRLLSSVSRVDLHRMRTGQLAPADYRRIVEGQQRLSSVVGRLAVDETSAITIPEVRAKVRRMQRSGLPIGLVVVDYIGLMGVAAGSRYESRNQQLGAVSRGLKQIAKDLNVPILALAQLSRDVEKRAGGNYKPKLSDLRDSGELEQDADLVLFPYRPAYYDDLREKMQTDDELTEAEIIVAKQRNGDVGSITANWDASCARFSSRETRYASV